MAFVNVTKSVTAQNHAAPTKTAAAVKSAPPANVGTNVRLNLLARKDKFAPEVLAYQAVDPITIVPIPKSVRTRNAKIPALNRTHVEKTPSVVPTTTERFACVLMDIKAIQRPHALHTNAELTTNARPIRNAARTVPAEILA